MPAMKPGRVTHTAMVLDGGSPRTRIGCWIRSWPDPSRMFRASGYGSPETVSPGQDRVHLQLLADYAMVDYVRDHRLPRRGLAGVGDARRNHRFGGQRWAQFTDPRLASFRRMAQWILSRAAYGSMNSRLVNDPIVGCGIGVTSDGEGAHRWALRTRLERTPDLRARPSSDRSAGQTSLVASLGARTGTR